MDGPFDGSISSAARCSHGKLTDAKLKGPVRSTSNVLHADLRVQRSAARACGFEALLSLVVTSSAQRIRTVASTQLHVAMESPMTTPPSDSDVEKEKQLATRQAGLVDSAFEEGQYESGIAMLEQLCSPTDYPSKCATTHIRYQLTSLDAPHRSHIRQLLYIALYPPPNSRTAAPKHRAAQESPSKISSRHAYSTLLPSPAASELAKRTLLVLADVNSPTSLLRALPAYPDPIDGNSAPSLVNPELPSDADSFVALEAVRFRDCKNCWNILKSAFIKSLSESTSFTPGSPRKRRRGESLVKYAHMDEEESSLVVGENAWPVLGWLLFLFEKDELSTEASRKGSTARHSQLKSDY